MHWLGFVVAIVAAGVFYWLRNQHRVVYGATEIVVGLAILLVVFGLIPTPVMQRTAASPLGIQCQTSSASLPASML